MRKISCIVVDDESIARNAIVNYVNKVDQLELKGSFKNALETKNFLKGENIDLIFLDINMPYITGIEFLRILPNQPHVIFTTAYSEHALESFEFNVIDYLLKPISFQRFMQSITKTIRVMTNIIAEERPTLMLKDGSNMLRINIDEILYVEAMQNYIRIFTEIKNHTILMTLKELKSKLSEIDFYQTHRSYIVQLSKIERVEGDLLIIGKYSVPVSKRTKSSFLRHFNNE